jgi:hypothetical protein
MTVRWWALRAGRPSPPRRFLVIISVRGWVNSRAMVRLEGLGQLKKKSTSSGLEPATFQLVAKCLNELRYRVPPVKPLGTSSNHCALKGEYRRFLQPRRHVASSHMHIVKLSSHVRGSRCQEVWDSLLQSTVVTIRTTYFNIKKAAFCTHNGLK